MAAPTERKPRATRAIAVITAIVAVVATGLWIGGLVTLGAIVAPIVFRNVPAPASADAMTLVFRRFDRVAITCAGVVMLVEVARAVSGLRLTRVDVARACFALAGAATTVFQATTISPRIEALHHEGAIRGLGDAGLELEAVHRIAESLGKAQLIIALALIALHVTRVADLAQLERAIS
jgi:uncharacterized membrane protein